MIRTVLTILTSVVISVAVIVAGGYFLVQYGEGWVEDITRSVLEDVAEEEGGVLAGTYEEQVIAVAEQADPAVVSVVSSREVSEEPRTLFEELFGQQVPEQQGGGSGFLVSSDGYVVTNRHVVDREDRTYSIIMNNGATHEVEVVARDPVLDVAILRVSDDVDEEFEFLSLKGEEGLRIGQSVVAVGNALGEFQNSVSVGVVSGLSRSIVAGDGSGRREILDEVIQTDAAINFGNSGGPLLNLSGEVVGINVAIAAGSQNVGFAVPAYLIEPVVRSVRETGEIVRAFLGVQYVPVNRMIQEQEDLPVGYGALIVEGANGQGGVVPDSPADQAGIEPGDVIIEIDGVRLDEQRSLAHIIRTREVGETVEIVLLRDGEEMTVSATLVEVPDE